MKFLLFFALLFFWTTNAVTHTQEQLEFLQDYYEEEKLQYIWWDERISELVKYQIKYCISRIWEGEIIVNGIDYSCQQQTLTRTAENWAWGWWVVSPTKDYWICQLHYKYHKQFIDSEEFKDPKAQIRYCQEVREDAIRKWSMPWYAYERKNSVLHLFKRNEL